jgi:hypothetical protein
VYKTTKSHGFGSLAFYRDKVNNKGLDSQRQKQIVHVVGSCPLGRVPSIMVQKLYSGEMSQINIIVFALQKKKKKKKKNSSLLAGVNEVFIHSSLK